MIYNKRKTRESGKKKSIRFVITIGLLAIVLFPAIVLSFMSSMTMNNLLVSNLKQNQMVMANEIALSIRDDVMSIDQATISLSQQKNLLSENEQLINDTIKQACDQDDMIKEIYFATEDGTTYTYPKKNLKATYDPRINNWYIGAKSNPDQIFYAPVFLSKKTGKDTMRISYNIKRNNKIVGVVATSVYIDDFFKGITDKTIGEKGYAYVVDAEGLMLANRDAALLKTNFAEEIGLWEQIKSQDDGLGEYYYNDEEMFCSYKKLEPFDWKVITTSPQSEIQDSVNKFYRNMIIIGVLTCIFAFIMSYFLVRYILVPLKTLTTGCRSIAKGDLTTKIKLNRQDEFGQIAEDFNQMSNHLMNLTKQVKMSTSHVKQGADELELIMNKTHQSAQEISQGAEEIAISAMSQAEEMEEMNSNISHLASIIEKNASAFAHMHNVSNQANEQSHKGMSKVTYLSEMTNETIGLTADITNIVENVDSDAKSISDIIETISQIADQINLLALNAAIEASRAGEHGRGFAVVAEEVRKLSSHTNDAIEDIDQRISKIQKSTKDAVVAMHNAKEHTYKQQNVVNETVEVFSDINQFTNNISHEVEDVRVLNEQLVENKNTILSMVESVAAMTEETSATTEEVSASIDQQVTELDAVLIQSKALLETANQLTEAMKKFKVE